MTTKGDSVEEKVKVDEEQINVLQPSAFVTREEDEIDEDKDLTTSTKIMQQEVIDSSVTYPLREEQEDDENKFIRKNRLQDEEIESSERLKRKRSFPPFCFLHPYGYLKWDLWARVEQKFNVQQSSTGKRMKLLLIDAEGTKLEASMRDGDIDRLEGLVEEGKVYTFSAVDVKNALTQYKLVKSDIECMFTNETHIEEQEDDKTIPMFSFNTFDRLYAFEGNKCLLIDVMAMVRDVGPIYYKHNGDRQVPKRDILLVDKKLQHVKLVVSDKLAILDSNWKDALSNGTIIVATALLVNCFRDFMLLYSSYMSRVFFDPPIKEVQNVKMGIVELLQGKYIASCSIGGVSMVPVNLSNAKRIAVQELEQFSSFNNNKSGLYEVKVTLTKVYFDEHNSLWYLGCTRCKTRLLDAPNEEYWCRKCEQYSEGCMRYVFRMEIADHTGCHDVTVFDDVGEKLLGCKANFLFELCKKETSHTVIMERVRAITYYSYNLFVMVESKDKNLISRPRHEINIIHIARVDPAKESKYLLDDINTYT